MAQQVKKPTSIHDKMGSIPGLSQWVKDLVLPQIWHGYGCGGGWQLQLRCDP